MGLHRELELMAEMDQLEESLKRISKELERLPGRWATYLLVGVILSWGLGVYTGVRAAADRAVPVPVPAEIMTYKGFIGPLGVQVTWRSGR